MSCTFTSGNSIGSSSALKTTDHSDGVVIWPHKTVLRSRMSRPFFIMSSSARRAAKRQHITSPRRQIHSCRCVVALLAGLVADAIRCGDATFGNWRIHTHTHTHTFAHPRNGFANVMQVAPAVNFNYFLRPRAMGSGWRYMEVVWMAAASASASGGSLWHVF